MHILTSSNFYFFNYSFTVRMELQEQNQKEESDSEPHSEKTIINKYYLQHLLKKNSIS